MIVTCVTPTELHGSDPSGRASKSFLDFYIADFDRAAIKGAIEGQLGHPLAIEDMPGIELSLNLFSNDFEGYQPTLCLVPPSFRARRTGSKGVLRPTAPRRALPFMTRLTTPTIRHGKTAAAPTSLDF